MAPNYDLEMKALRLNFRPHLPHLLHHRLRAIRGIAVISVLSIILITISALFYRRAYTDGYDQSQMDGILNLGTPVRIHWLNTRGHEHKCFLFSDGKYACVR